MAVQINAAIRAKTMANDAGNFPAFLFNASTFVFTFIGNLLSDGFVDAPPLRLPSQKGVETEWRTNSPVPSVHSQARRLSFSTAAIRCGRARPLTRAGASLHLPIFRARHGSRS